MYCGSGGRVAQYRMLRISRPVLAGFLVLSVGCPLVASADAYGYADEDGTLILTDTPSGERFALLAVAPVEPVDVGAVLMPPLSGAPRVAELSVSQQHVPLYDLVNGVAASSGVDGRLLHAVIMAESNYNPAAVSPKGAGGLMQLMPQTARRYGVSNVFDPVQNIQGGAHYLADLLRLFNNDRVLAVAAYNAGEGAVIQHGKKVPPFRETVSYVSKVMAFYQQFEQRASGR